MIFQENCLPNYAGLSELLTHSWLHTELNKYKAQLQKIEDGDKPSYFLISDEQQRQKEGPLWWAKQGNQAAAGQVEQWKSQGSCQVI